DNLSVYDWIESRVPGGHRSPMGLLLDVAYTEELAVASQVQSSLNLIYLLGFQADEYPAQTDEFDIFGVSDERFHVAGGNQQIPEAIAARLGPDVVRRGCRMESLRRNPDGRFTVTFDAGAPDRAIVADYVVLCIPFPVLRTLDFQHAGFDPLKIHTIRTL